MPVIIRTLPLAFMLAAVLAPVASSAAPPLASWAGRYEDDSMDQVLTIDSQGQVELEGRTSNGGDALFRFGARGTLASDGARLRLTLRPHRGVADMMPLPEEIPRQRSILPLTWEGRRLLLDEEALNGIVNKVNMDGQRRVQLMFGFHDALAAGEAPGRRIDVDADAILPPEYRARILAKPISGRVVKVIASVPVLADGSRASAADVLQESNAAGPGSPVYLHTTLEVDLGRAEGVFAGMWLCVVNCMDWYRVDHVGRHRSTVSATNWHAAVNGALVTSSALKTH